MLRPNLDVFIDVCGLPDQYKNKADTKLTVVMCVRFLRHLAAISAGNRCHGRPVDKIRIFLISF